jgi:copper chaperone CopZ
MESKAKEMRIRLQGITCSGCAEDMQKVLRDKEGIIDAKVDYAEGIVSVRYKPESVDRKKVYLLVRSLGFSADIISES